MSRRSDYYWTTARCGESEDDGPTRQHSEAGIEAEPETSQDYLRAASDWLWEVDERLNYTYASQRIARILGTSVENLLGCYIFPLTYFKQVDSDLLSIIEALQDRIAFRNRSVVLRDTRGNEHILSLSGVPIFDPASGRFMGYRGIGSEVTKHRVETANQARESVLYRDFAEIAADWLWETDPDLCVTFLSAGYDRHGSRPASDSLGQPLPEICNADESLRARLERRQPFRWSKAKWARAAGEKERCFLLSGHPLFDEAGGFLGYRGVATEWSETLSDQDLVSATRALAEPGIAARSEHLCNLSHELRTPLNAIIGFSDAMRNEVMGKLPNAQYRQYAQDIHDSARHILEMVNGVLDLSRIEAGNIELNAERVKVREVVDECLRMLREQAEKARVGMKLECVETLPDLVADRVKLKQIVLNLLSNALKFTPPDGQVVVVARLVANGCLEIEVRDTGVGIDSKDIPKVLARFGQAAAGRDRQGTGLGLAITKSLIEMHGGVLKIVSGEGVGTRALVQLPKERVLVHPEDDAEKWKILL